MQAKRVKPMADLLGGEKNTKILYTDHLTPKNQGIMMQAKGIWSQFIVWTKNGDVYCRKKEEGSPVIKLETSQDVEELKEKIREQDQSDTSASGQKRTLSERSPPNENFKSKKTPKKGIQIENFKFGKLTPTQEK